MTVLLFSWLSKIAELSPLGRANPTSSAPTRADPGLAVAGPAERRNYRALIGPAETQPHTVAHERHCAMRAGIPCCQTSFFLPLIPTFISFPLLSPSLRRLPTSPFLLLLPSEFVCFCLLGYPPHRKLALSEACPNLANPSVGSKMAAGGELDSSREALLAYTCAHPSPRKSRPRPMG